MRKWDEMAGEISDDVVRLFAAVARPATWRARSRCASAASRTRRDGSGGYGTRLDIPPDLAQGIPRVFSGYGTSG